jgi:pimeloyl-ACP methyl ester carboxylesterase
VRKHTRALERRFIVVNWDQRGAGKSFAAGRDAAHMNMGQFVEDVIAVSSYLANRFREARIVLVGHSWGSAIGLRAVAKRPDLFSAYVGIGQLARAAEGELISYRWTLEQAQRAGATATVQALTKIGPPPYAGPDWRSKLLAQRRTLAKYGGEYRGSATGAFGVLVKHVMASREYTFADRINFFRGLTRSLDLLFPALDDLDFFAEIPTVAVPIYFCLGRHDYEVPSGVAARYFEMLNAPSKRLIWFEQSAHMPNIEEQDAFNRFMAETLRPVL